MTLNPAKPRTWPILSLCALLLAIALAGAFSLPKKEPADSLIAARDDYSLRRGTPPLPAAPVSVSRQTLLRGTLLLVSSQHPLPPDYPLPSTRAIRAMVGSYLPAEENTALIQEAIYALCNAQVKRDLASGAVLTVGAVSPGQQEEWRREAYQRFSKVYPLEEALDRAYQAVPGGGQSEHQTGCAVDIRLTGPLFMGESNPLRRNETGQWIDTHLWRYGFIQRYALGEETEGGCENIHLRYVGPLHAAAMHTLNGTLEEYLALLRREGAVTLYQGEQPLACMFCLPCSGDCVFSLPANALYTFSADNTGWAIATAELR